MGRARLGQVNRNEVQPVDVVKRVREGLVKQWNDLTRAPRWVKDDITNRFVEVEYRNIVLSRWECMSMAESLGQARQERTKDLKTQAMYTGPLDRMKVDEVRATSEAHDE